MNVENAKHFILNYCLLIKKFVIINLWIKGRLSDTGEHVGSTNMLCLLLLYLIRVSFCFLLSEFYCTFSIAYKILQYYVYYYCILIRM